MTYNDQQTITKRIVENLEKKNKTTKCTIMLL